MDGLSAESRLSDTHHGECDRGNESVHDEYGGAEEAGEVMLVVLVGARIGQAAQTPSVGLPATRTQNEVQRLREMQQNQIRSQAAERSQAVGVGW